MNIPTQGWSRAVYRLLAMAAGSVTAWLKRVGPHAPPPEVPPPLPDGISVVVITRNRRELLERSLPAILAQLNSGRSEVIVVDTASTDGTAAWLHLRYPEVIADASSELLPYAHAVNRGASRASLSHICILSSDMIPADGFFAELRCAFERVPDLFCAAAQAGSGPGENYSYVLHGGAAGSMYDTRLWRAIGGMSQIYDSAAIATADLGFRAWRQGWPTVFVSRAQILQPCASDSTSEATAARDYFRFLAHAVTDPPLFARLWRDWVRSVNVRAGKSADFTVPLRVAALGPGWIRPQPPPVLAETEIFAVTGGDVAVFAGIGPRRKPVILTLSSKLPSVHLARCAAADYDQILISIAGDLHPPERELLDAFVEIVLVRAAGAVDTFRAALRQTVRKWKPAIAQFESANMAQFAAECAPARAVLVEHSPAPPGARPTEPRRILLAGPVSDRKHIAAVRWFLEEVWPQLKPVSPILHIVIERADLDRFFTPADLHLPDIEWDTSTPDLRAAYSRAAVVVVPVRVPAGTNTTIREAMAMGKAVVTTSAGIEGSVVVDSSADMAAVIAALIAEPELRRKVEHRAAEHATAEPFRPSNLPAGRKTA